MSRSAHGFSTACEEWRAQAVCARNPDMWSKESQRRAAMHVCLRHCPVLTPCRADAEANPPIEMVQGGMAFNQFRKPVWGGQLQADPSCPACTPPPPRLLPPSDTGACGTPKGASRHVRWGELTCRSCREAMVRKMRADRAAKRRAEAPSEELADRRAVLLGEEAMR